VTVAPLELLAATVRFEEQISTIGVLVLTTVTWNEQLVTWPQLSLAVQVTTVKPTAKLVPLGGVQVRLVTPQPPVALEL
jgi:hypothetical protein